jgi:uncharacterized protein YcaQ
MLSITQARALHLAAQGLLQAPLRKATRPALLRTIERMALLQIDTLHVVNRSPYLVLFARLGHYPPVWLEDALAQGQLFETWAHEACFAPRADLLLHRAYNRSARRHWGLASAAQSHSEQRPHLDKLLAHIRTSGPVKSSDFKRTDTRASAWWGWKDEKRWLEALFASGELMVARRENFHRVYDLTERVAVDVLDAEAKAASPEAAQVRGAWIEKAVAALGITQARWINDYFRTKPRLRDADLDALVEAGVLLRLAVDGWASPAYVHHSNQALLAKAAADKLQATHTALLSPFDPVVWDRERASTLFDFDYRLECYTPEPKRVYGYFVLPILCCGELIGRLDAKAHRALGVFEVRALFAQPGTAWTDAQVESVAGAVADFAAWHGTPEVQVMKAQPVVLLKRLRSALAVRAVKERTLK